MYACMYVGMYACIDLCNVCMYVCVYVMYVCMYFSDSQDNIVGIVSFCSRKIPRQLLIFSFFHVAVRLSDQFVAHVNALVLTI